MISKVTKKGLSVDECAKTCDEDSSCAAFEIGTGKIGSDYKKGDCRLQSVYKSEFEKDCKE
jgi:hypothetical protein